MRWRNTMSVLLSTLLALPAYGARQERQTVQEKVGEIATGSVVEVKTSIKGMKTVHGRLGAVTADGFEIQTAKGNNVENVKLKFADVKSVKELPRGNGRHAGVLILAGVGVALLVMMVIGAIVTH